MTDSVPGWDAISAHFDAAYPGQRPFHYGTIIKWAFGGKDPLDGISVYRAAMPAPHWHYVTYGYSDLYSDEVAADPEADSGYGIEMTFRLYDPLALDPEASPPTWVINLLQNLARYTFRSGNVIYARHHLNANGPIALDTATKLTALAFTDDPIGTPLHTPAGLVRLVLGVGITAEELTLGVNWNTEALLDVIGRRWPRGLTFLDRPGIEDDPALVAEMNAGREREGSSLSYSSVETLAIESRPEGLVITLSAFAPPAVARAVGARLPYGKPVTFYGDSDAVEFFPEAGEVVRAQSTEAEPARVSLTPAGVAALAALPTTPGDHTLDAVPGVIWRLVETDKQA
jgi:hypothetical protein